MVTDKRLTVLLIVLMESVIVEVYFNDMACKKFHLILNYSETMTCFTFLGVKFQANYIAKKKLIIAFKIMNTE